MQNDPTAENFLNYKWFKNITEQRRWLVKVYVCLESGEWESCGKGILKFYQFSNSQELKEILKKTEVNTDLQNLFAMVEPMQDSSNSHTEIRNCRKFSSVLKFRNLNSENSICFYNMKLAYNLELEYLSRLIRQDYQMVPLI